MIQLDNVTRWFGATCAVDNLSFHVNAGEVYGFIGPNGAGKTTSMRILSTLDVPTFGNAWVDGFSVVNDPDRVRRRLGFMPDNFGTYPNTTCEEYLDFFARSYGLRGRERRQSQRDVMGFTQLDRLAQKPVNGLSKGMRQRLCLGRALIHDPMVLILDEPAAGLDPRARIELREMIGALADRGKALLVSSHILTELAEMCDRVAIIEKGRLLANGTVEEILRHGGTSTDGGDGEQPRLVNVVVVTVLNDLDRAQHWLSERDFNPRTLSPQSLKGMAMAAHASRSLEFDFQGTEQEQAELLSEMVAAKLPLTGFGVKQRSLEDAFLQVTLGDVQ